MMTSVVTVTMMGMMPCGGKELAEVRYYGGVIAPASRREYYGESPSKEKLSGNYDVPGELIVEEATTILSLTKQLLNQLI
jgi:hypothetical protein